MAKKRREYRLQYNIQRHAFFYRASNACASIIVLHFVFIFTLFKEIIGKFQFKVDTVVIDRKVVHPGGGTLSAFFRYSVLILPNLILYHQGH